MLVNHNISNLSGGISQQSDIARYDNQVETMVNFVPTVAQGLRRRNPISQLRALTTDTNMAMHSYSRGDNDEKYMMTLSDSGLKVFDSTIDYTVTDFGGVGETILEQWDATDWENDIRFLTVGDTTWILNTSVTVEATADVTPSDANANSVFYWLKRSFDDGSGHGYAYQVVLDDVKFNAVYPDAAAYDEWGADATEREANWGYTYDSAKKGLTFSDSVLAATALSRYIDAYPYKGYTAKSEGSIVYITCATAFTFSSGDSWGNQASIGWKDSVAKIADLPASMEGFTSSEIGTIAIAGTDKDSFTNYYLMWDTDHWKETIKESIEYKIDHLTMPAKLVRQGDGTFSLGWNVENLALDGFHTVWNDRSVGDDDSNPMPSFIDSKLSNMFFFKNRLGFTSEENVLLSETGSYYNFMATTVMEILDSDPIDAAVDSNDISIIRAVNVTSGAITMWSDSSQFMLSGGEILSPATTRISKTSDYSSYLDIEPIGVDNEVLFFDKSGDYLNVFTYAPASLNNDKSTAESISSHIPEYLPSTISIVKSAPIENMVFFFDVSNPTKVFVYKYHVNNNKRVMSAWFEWTFGITIKKIDVLDNELILVSDALYGVDLSVRPVTELFLDKGTDSFESKVRLSRFHIQTKQNTQMFREKFYVKTVVSKVEGSVDILLSNEERGTSKTIGTKHVNLGRKIIVGGHSDKVKIEYNTSYDTGVAVESLNLEGLFKYRSINKD